MSEREVMDALLQLGELANELRMMDRENYRDDLISAKETEFDATAASIRAAFAALSTPPPTAEQGKGNDFLSGIKHGRKQGFASAAVAIFAAALEMGEADFIQMYLTEAASAAEVDVDAEIARGERFPGPAQECSREIDALAAQAPPPVVEAVAWRYRKYDANNVPMGFCNLTHDEAMAKQQAINGCVVRPLFDHPAPAPVVDAWRPIAEIPNTDDLFWFRRGNNIDGPAHYDSAHDPDSYDYFAPCEPPTVALASHKPEADDAR
jgi:hypothetical protein